VLLPHSTDPVQRARTGDKLPSIMSAPAIMIPNVGPLSVGCFPYPPLSQWIESVLRPSGPWPMLVTEVLLKKKLGFQFVPVSAATFALGYHQARPDIIMGCFKTDNRANSYDFSQPVHRIRLNGVCRKTQESITEADLALGRWNIVVQEGEVGWEYAMSKFEHAKKLGKILPMKSTTTHEISDLLLAERRDEFGNIQPRHHVAISDVVSCVHFIRNSPFGSQFKLAFREPNELPIFDARLAVKLELFWDMDEINALISIIKKRRDYSNLERTSILGYEKLIELCS
jgi:Bacterial extracellular solute-binding proteins, family 3